MDHFPHTYSPVICRLLSTTPSPPIVPTSSPVHMAHSIHPGYRPNQYALLLGGRYSTHSHYLSQQLHSQPGPPQLRRHPSPTSSNHRIPHRILRTEVEGLGPLSECARLRVLPATPFGVAANPKQLCASE